MAFVKYGSTVSLLKDYGQTTVRFLVITDILLQQIEPAMREKILAAAYYTDYVNRARFIRDDSNLASWLMLKYNDIKSVDAVFTIEP